MKKVDLTGQRFGMLIVLHEADRKGKNGELYWHCRCDCGNEKDFIGQNLKKGFTKSCGCTKGAIIGEDLTGQRFGMLTVLERSEQKNYYWLCRCDCGKTVEVQVYKLKTGHTQSCGCMKSNDLTGKRFGRLLVLRRSERKTDYGQSFWICRCDCGNEKEVIHSSLTCGTVLSCGCLHQDSAQKKSKMIKELKTNPDIIRNSDRLRKDNKTGVTGVTYNQKTGIYTARIGFKGVRYVLTRSSDINKCIAARKEAEKEIFGNFLEWYDAHYPKDRISEERKNFLEEKKKKV